MEKTYRPLGDRVVLELLEEEGRTKSGIVLPDSAKEKPQEGMVIAVGLGRVLENGEKVPSEVKKGDRVLFQKYAGTEVKIGEEDQKLLVVAEKDILAIIEGAAEKKAAKKAK